jgi:hypothetical protein
MARIRSPDGMVIEPVVSGEDEEPPSYRTVGIPIPGLVTAGEPTVEALVTPVGEMPDTPLRAGEPTVDADVTPVTVMPETAVRAGDPTVEALVTPVGRMLVSSTPVSPSGRQKVSGSANVCQKHSEPSKTPI